METSFTMVPSASTIIDGSSAISFDSSKLVSLIQNRGSRFKLNLAGYSLSQVLNAYADFKRKMSPRYRNANVLSNIKKMEEFLGVELMPIDITDEWYVEAFNFFRSIRNRNGDQMNPSTIKTYFTSIAASLSWAGRHGCEIDPTYNVFKIKDYEGARVALTPSQIAHIYYFDINNEMNRRKLVRTMKELKYFRYSFGLIEKVRDMFVFGCQIGQRYSDVIRYDKTNFDQTGTVFSCTQQKTGGKAKVDLTKYAVDKSIAFEILRKYDYKCPAYKLDNANVNKILHAICKTIGGEFLDNVKVVNKISGELEESTSQLWQLVTSHVARRTFITYHCNNENVSIVKLQKCTGHKEVKHLSRYCIDNE